MALSSHKPYLIVSFPVISPKSRLLACSDDPFGDGVVIRLIECLECTTTTDNNQIVRKWKWKINSLK